MIVHSRSLHNFIRGYNGIYTRVIKRQAQKIHAPVQPKIDTYLRAVLSLTTGRGVSFPRRFAGTSREH